jgi:hypothetical protein
VDGSFHSFTDLPELRVCTKNSLSWNFYTPASLQSFNLSNADPMVIKHPIFGLFPEKSNLKSELPVGSEPAPQVIEGDLARTPSYEVSVTRQYDLHRTYPVRAGITDINRSDGLILAAS